MSLVSNASFTFRQNLPLLDSMNNVASFYLFAAKGTPWPNDTIPPSVDNSVALNEYQILNELLFGKFVENYPSGIVPMTTRYDWVSGTVYSRYDDKDETLFEKPFFVLTSETGNYHVFKCLDNNGGAPSLYQPKLTETSASDEYYSTADGYQWKYMYSFDTFSFSRFATSSYIPVIANNDVTSNSVSGSIETYIIDNPGGNYNSTTNGYFTDISVGGNNQFFSLQGSDTTVITTSPNTFIVGETLSQTYGNSTVTGIISSQTTTPSKTVLSVSAVNGIFNNSNVVVGLTSSSIGSVYDTSSPTVSSNSNFYNGCTLYISSGTGSGQLNTIEEYVVVGNARRVLLKDQFAIQPDFTSKYVISPRVEIVGDGSNAAAISIIDPNTKQLSKIQIIDKGRDYTYANVAVYGNTGSTQSNSNNAIVRAVMSPRGGHGSDVYKELSATYLCYSTTFVDTESGKIPGTGSTYRRIGVLTNPLFANVTLTYSYNVDPNFPLSSDVIISGSNSGAEGFVTNKNSLTNTVSLTNVNGVFLSNDILSARYSNGQIIEDGSSNAVVVSVAGQSTTFDNRTLLICSSSSLTGGVFSVNDKIVQTTLGVDSAYAIIQDIQTSGSDTYIYLSEVKGTFQNSDTGTSTYQYIYDDATRQTRIRVDDIVAPDLVPYTGNILYVENIVPVIRSDVQEETVKIVVGFT